MQSVTDGSSQTIECATTLRGKLENKFSSTPTHSILIPGQVKARIGNAIGPYEDLLTSVKRCKLKWFGHVTRSSGLAKTVLQGTTQRRRRRGRQRKRWEDIIKEWTGLEWNVLLRESREPRGVEEAGFKMYSGAPTVSKTTG